MITYKTVCTANTQFIWQARVREPKGWAKTRSHFYLVMLVSGVDEDWEATRACKPQADIISSYLPGLEPSQVYFFRVPNNPCLYSVHVYEFWMRRVATCASIFVAVREKMDIMFYQWTLSSLLLFTLNSLLLRGIRRETMRIFFSQINSPILFLHSTAININKYTRTSIISLSGCMYVRIILVYCHYRQIEDNKLWEAVMSLHETFFYVKTLENKLK